MGDIDAKEIVAEAYAGKITSWWGATFKKCIKGGEIHMEYETGE